MHTCAVILGGTLFHKEVPTWSMVEQHNSNLCTGIRRVEGLPELHIGRFCLKKNKNNGLGV